MSESDNQLVYRGECHHIIVNAGNSQSGFGDDADCIAASPSPLSLPTSLLTQPSCSVWLIELENYSCETNWTDFLAMPYLSVLEEEGTREGTVFYHIGDGLFYHKFATSRRGIIYYRCIFSERGYCGGRATFNCVDGFVHTCEHNHDPDIAYPEEVALKKNLIQGCENLDGRR